LTHPCTRLSDKGNGLGFRWLRSRPTFFSKTLKKPRNRLTIRGSIVSSGSGRRCTTR